jgi:hypothetical protein
MILIHALESLILDSNLTLLSEEGIVISFSRIFILFSLLLKLGAKKLWSYIEAQILGFWDAFHKEVLKNKDYLTWKNQGLSWEARDVFFLQIPFDERRWLWLWRTLWESSSNFWIEFVLLHLQDSIIVSHGMITTWHRGLSFTTNSLRFFRDVQLRDTTRHL